MAYKSKRISSPRTKVTPRTKSYEEKIVDEYVMLDRERARIQKKMNKLKDEIIDMYEKDSEQEERVHGTYHSVKVVRVERSILDKHSLARYIGMRKLEEFYMTKPSVRLYISNRKP